MGKDDKGEGLWVGGVEREGGGEEEHGVAGPGERYIQEGGGKGGCQC